MRRVLIVAISLLVIGMGAVWAANYFLVGVPVSERLATDPRNESFDLRARFQYYVFPQTLVLDLREVDTPAPVDLLRGVFQSAEVFHERNQTFERVILARNGKPVFLLTGESFAETGTQMSYGENPVYMLRKFPSKLHRTDGTAAYGEWTGGLLGVLAEEMDDVNEAISAWIAGTVP